MFLRLIYYTPTATFFDRISSRFNCNLLWPHLVVTVRIFKRLIPATSIIHPAKHFRYLIMYHSVYRSGAQTSLTNTCGSHQDPMSSLLLQKHKKQKTTKKALQAGRQADRHSRQTAYRKFSVGCRLGGGLRPPRSPPAARGGAGPLPFC